MIKFNNIFRKLRNVASSIIGFKKPHDKEVDEILIYLTNKGKNVTKDGIWVAEGVKIDFFL